MDLTERRGEMHDVLEEEGLNHFPEMPLIQKGFAKQSGDPGERAGIRGEIDE